MKNSSMASSLQAPVTTFLSTVGRCNVHIQHIAGVDNLVSNQASRNPAEYPDSSCKICKFIAELEDSVKHSISLSDVLYGCAHIPFSLEISTATMSRTPLNPLALKPGYTTIQEGN